MSLSRKQKRLECQRIHEFRQRNKKSFPVKQVSSDYLPRELYLNFYKSDWWKDLRSRKLKREKCCYICSTANWLQVHHIGYKNIYRGRIDDALKDTVVLCRECHGAVHSEQKRRGLKTGKTMEIIMEIKNTTLAERLTQDF